MPRILLVKTSSLGDVVHNLPAASDIASRFPDAQIDWVVEESFAALTALHTSVRRTIPVAVRRWRASPWKTDTRREIGALAATLREERYDAVIDAQGLFKSALIARLARGTRYGLDWASSREPLALFYDRTFSIARSLHAVERNRRLAAHALRYEISDSVDYGIRAERNFAGRPGWAWLPASEYCVLLHATSAARKLWPEAHWIALGRALEKRAVRCVLPWGNEEERARSERIASAVQGAVTPPRLPLGDVAALLSAARCVVGVDTGLSHLACALGVPTVAIYVDTDPALTGLYGCARGVNVGRKAALPGVDEVLAALEHVRS